MKKAEDKSENPPEAPIEYTNTEASIWQFGWSSGYTEGVKEVEKLKAELKEQRAAYIRLANEGIYD